MRDIKITVDFTNGTIAQESTPLTSGDYNSSRLCFEFDADYSDKRLVFEMKDTNGDLLLCEEIDQNTMILILAGENDGNTASLFACEGRYPFEISMYGNDSKLTSASSSLIVTQEEVVIDGETVEPYLPLFDQILQEVETISAATNKLIHLDSAEIGSALNMGILSEGEIVVLFITIDTALIDVEIELPYLIDLYNVTANMGGTITVYSVKALDEIAQQFPGYQGIKYNGFDNQYDTIITYGVSFLFDTVDHADAFFLQMSEADLTAATIFSPSAEEVTAHLRGE